jgi:hypothetical protein
VAILLAIDCDITLVNTLKSIIELCFEFKKTLVYLIRVVLSNKYLEIVEKHVKLIIMPSISKFKIEIKNLFFVLTSMHDEMNHVYLPLIVPVHGSPVMVHSHQLDRGTHLESKFKGFGTH